MTKKNKLYTVTRFNKPMFMGDRESQNIFDGFLDSKLNAQHGGALLAADRLASAQFGANYGEAGNTLSDYMNSTNALGISKADNPFSKMNLKGGLGAMANTPIGGSLVSGIAGAVGGLANNAISGGLESGAGSAISNIGSTVGSAVGAVNPILGAAVGVGSQLVGGLVNRAFGTKVDQEKLNNVNANINSLNSFTSNAGSFDEIQGPQAVSMDTDVYEGGWFSSDDAEDKNEELRQRLINAKQFAQRSVDNNINNLIDDQINNALANYSAFGGPLGAETVFQHSGQIMDNDDNMGAIEYGFMSDYLDNKRQQTEQKNQLGNLFIGTPGSMLAFGGDLQAHGGDYPTGLTHIDTGGSHEENPYDGVQMGIDQEGTPNLVEEGEAIWNDYVFSNRINMSEEAKKVFRFPKKKDITYAEAAKRLEKEIAERPNDPISEAGFKAQMQNLEEQQELQKQQMEAERAKAAFEALSPEEQVAVMQQAEQQEAVAQQAAQEKTIVQQQPSPEEVAMAEQQMADGSQVTVGQEPQMSAYGGKINKFDKGGEIKKKIYELLGIGTDEKFQEWASKHGNREFIGRMKDVNWEKALEDMELMEAVAGNNNALRDALSKGYDFGLFKPENNGKATIQSISRGNWKATNGAGWLGSDDPAWLEATKDMSEEDIKKLSTEDVAKLMRATNSYKKGTEWLQNKDNALLYLKTLMDDANTPQVAKDYAAKFVKDGQWKDGFNYDYATVFGSNGKGVRETNPGTYWHTPVEAIRGTQAQNWVINDDGSVEEIIGEVPADWTAAGNYSWATPENDITYNYYQRPITPAAPEDPEVYNASVEDGEDEKQEPKLRPEWMRYAGLFGPAVGLGMMAAGVGKPDYSKLDATLEHSGDVTTAGYKPISNYLTYRPMDIWFEQNRMDANARATDRAIQNNAAPIGTKMAGLLASGYNSQIADGELYRKALEYNDAKRAQVGEFNRGTDMFNAQAYNQNQQFNADARNRARQYRASLAMQAATERLNRDAGWYNSLYGNVAGLFRGLSDLGRENAQWNMISRGAADGVYGNLGDSWTGQKVIKRKAEGGKVRKKKGLTY